MKYSIVTFGCRTNQADSFDLERDFRSEGGVPSAPESADVVVVNTCTVTAAADQAARNAIRRVARLNPAARIVVTGCYATRKPHEAEQLAPGVSVVANATRPRLLGSWDGDATSQGRKVARSQDSQFALSPGSLGRTAYPLRVQTGCDERCAYCIVPTTRGPGRSRPLDEVVQELEAAARAGFKEFWITGVHLGSYGRDHEPASSLVALLARLDDAASGLDVTFRLSSLEPMDCGDEILDCVAGSPRFLPHVHLPLQHASDRVLRAMRRPYDLARFRAAVEGIRRRLPDAAIGTDLIAGFPGETAREFEEQLTFLRGSPLTHVHVFPYSDRAGTEAAGMDGKVEASEVRRRAVALREAGAALNAAFLARQLGRDRRALTLHDGTLALTDNYMKVGIPGGLGRNQRVRVRLIAVAPSRGELVNAGGDTEA